MKKGTTEISPRVVAGVCAGGAVMFSLLNGCRFTEYNTRHCAYNDGDSYCREQFPNGEMPFCETGTPECASPQKTLGCIDSRPIDACYSPCGNLQSFAENDECLTVEDSSSSSSTAESGSIEPTESSESSSGTESSTGPMPCMSDEECTEASAPVCSPDGECVSCGQAATPEDADQACAGVDAQRPWCDADACVACRVGATEVCDEQQLYCAGNECAPCVEHGQCTSGACELELQRCFPTGAVGVSVDGDGGADAMTIADALTEIPAGAYGIVRVHELDGGGSYDQVLVDGGRTIALLAAEGQVPSIRGLMGNPGLSVEGAGTKMYAESLRVSGNESGLGLIVDGAFAWVDRSRVVQNSGGGVLARNGAGLTIRNCFIGGSVNGVPALEVDAASANVLYSTVTGGFAGASALACADGASVMMRNSILLVGGDSDEIVCPMAVLMNTATEATVGNFDGSQEWFVDYLLGDLLLSGDGAPVFANSAIWQLGDPAIDIDGDLRPADDGRMDYAGADVP